MSDTGGSGILALPSLYRTIALQLAREQNEQLEQLEAEIAALDNTTNEENDDDDNIE
jgi:hypothetical protein